MLFVKTKWYLTLCYLLSLSSFCVSVHIGLDFKNLIDDDAVLRSLSPNLQKTFLKERLIYNLTFGGGKRIFNISIPVPKFHLRVMQRGYSLVLPSQPPEVCEIEYFGRMNKKPAEHEVMRNLMENRNSGVFNNFSQKWVYLNFFQEFKRSDTIYCTIIANISNASHQERFVRHFSYRLSKYIELQDDERVNEDLKDPDEERDVNNLQGLNTGWGLNF